MRQAFFMFLVLGFGLLAWQGRVVAQGPLSAAGFLPTFDPEKKEHKEGQDADKKEHDKDDDDEHGHHELEDLLLRDFFHTGWAEKFEERERAGRAPRLDLFKTRQGFLEREINFNYAFFSRSNRGQFDENDASVGLEYALNRRFEIDVEPIYAWKRARGTRDSQQGLAWDFGTRFQLIDTEDWALNYQLHVLTPQSHLDQRQTAIGSVLAGFNDLTKCGLYRTGLYYHFEYDALAGPRADQPDAPGLLPGQLASSQIAYSAALAKTLVDPKVRYIGDFTLFVEAYGATSLNGSYRNQTYFSFTPGMRTNLTGREEKAWWLQAGVEIPVAGPRNPDMGVRISLFRDF